MTDEKIIDLYFERSETAIAETDAKYGKYCRYISHNILRDEGASDEAVNDTYVKTWNTIPPKRPESLKAYLGRICRNLSLNLYEAMRAKKRGGDQVALLLDELSECIPDSSVGEIGDNIALRELINRFVASLSDKARVIFVRRYFYAASISEIARDYSVSEGNVSIILMRSRQKLKEILIKEGYTV